MTDYAAKTKQYDVREQEAIIAFLKESLGGNPDAVRVRGGMLTMRADTLISALEHALGRDVIDRMGQA
jgi:hypothetical protein